MGLEDSQPLGSYYWIAGRWHKDLLLKLFVHWPMPSNSLPRSYPLLWLEYAPEASVQLNFHQQLQLSLPPPPPPPFGRWWGQHSLTHAPQHSMDYVFWDCFTSIGYRGSIICFEVSWAPQSSSDRFYLWLGLEGSRNILHDFKWWSWLFSCLEIKDKVNKHVR